MAVALSLRQFPALLQTTSHSPSLARIRNSSLFSCSSSLPPSPPALHSRKASAAAAAATGPFAVTPAWMRHPSVALPQSSYAATLSMAVPVTVIPGAALADPDDAGHNAAGEDGAAAAMADDGKSK
uniref:Uncharacterized protein n=1 Tax=Oryza brachyantha TaxID=4533 RepID=J3MFJ9_ORYBR